MSELLLILVAQQSGGGGGGAAGPGSPMVMMVLMFVVIYFMMIRPQQKRQKEHDGFLSALKNGDKVITNGGVYGIVSGITDDVVTLEIAKNTRIRIDKRQIAGPQRKPETAGSDAKSKSKSGTKAKA